jgi:hypothetical protein
MLNKTDSECQLLQKGQVLMDCGQYYPPDDVLSRRAGKAGYHSPYWTTHLLILPFLICFKCTDFLLGVVIVSKRTRSLLLSFEADTFFRTETSWVDEKENIGREPGVRRCSLWKFCNMCFSLLRGLHNIWTIGWGHTMVSFVQISYHCLPDS